MKRWWTIDRIIGAISLVVILFGWGVSWGVQSSKIASQEKEIEELKEFEKEVTDKLTEHEIKINNSADADELTADLIRIILNRAGTEGD